MPSLVLFTHPLLDKVEIIYFGKLCTIITAEWNCRNSLDLISVLPPIKLNGKTGSPFYRVVRMRWPHSVTFLRAITTEILTNHAHFEPVKIFTANEPALPGRFEAQIDNIFVKDTNRMEVIKVQDRKLAPEPPK